MRAGYKQTEVGVIPATWQVKQFSEVTDLITCGIAATPTYVSESQGFPFLSSTNVKYGRVVWSNYKYISGRLHRLLHTNNPPKRGDILYSRVGTIGEAAVVEVDFEFSVYVSLTLIKPKQSLDSYFLKQLLNSAPYKFRAKEQVYLGGGVGNLNVDVVRKYLIVLPPLPEQRAIAAALGDVDALLAKLDEFIAKKRYLKQATMQQLLTGQTRLPGFSGAWEVKRLDALADIRSGGTPSTTQPEFWNGEVLWCTPTDITALAGFKYLSHTTRTITTNGLQSSSAELIPTGSIVMTSRATIGECAINAVPIATNQGFKNFVPYPGTDGEFLYYLLQTKKQDFIGLCSGSTFLEIGKTQLVRFEIKVPDKTEQTAIATLLSDMDTELAALEARRDKTRALKQGMMQELLTGRIRLPAN